MNERLKQQLDFILEIDKEKEYITTDPPLRTRKARK